MYWTNFILKRPLNRKPPRQQPPQHPPLQDQADPHKMLQVVYQVVQRQQGVWTTLPWRIC